MVVTISIFYRRFAPVSRFRGSRSTVNSHRTIFPFNIWSGFANAMPRHVLDVRCSFFLPFPASREATQDIPFFCLWINYSVIYLARSSQLIAHSLKDSILLLWSMSYQLSAIIYFPSAFPCHGVLSGRSLESGDWSRRRRRVPFPSTFSLNSFSLTTWVVTCIFKYTYIHKNQTCISP